MLLVGCPLEKATQITEDVSTAIRDYRFVWKDKIFTIGVSIGLVEIGRESSGIEDVMSAADSACYVAKSRGQGQVHVYSSRDEAVARQRGEIHWLQRLQRALRDGRFVLYTQPIVASPSGNERGPAMEVLIRLAGEDGTIIARRRVPQGRGALPADVAGRPLGGADRARRARPRRDQARARAQPVA